MTKSKTTKHNFNSFIILASVIFLSQLVENSSYSKGTDFKTLYLVRHAKSSDVDPSLQDFDRPINERGFSDATAMGKRLHKMGIVPDIVIASPSKRTNQTIELICKEIQFDFTNIVWDSTIYRCQDKDMLNAILKISDEFQSAMIVGHNGTITNLANLFQADTTITDVPTCGVVAIQFETNSWSQINSKKGKLLFFEYPKRN